IVHGEEHICAAFSAELEEMGYRTYVPNFQARFDLVANAETDSGTPPVPAEEKEARKTKVNRVSSAFVRLLAAEKQLLQVVMRNEGGANKDLARFADQILALCKKWDR
ncbi:MAG TPA: MBL fold hydrolase, partial [Ruminococcaceae bacterium]|nr:MBL fold hydrolase [Oscillospiraceae bacterium]